MASEEQNIKAAYSYQRAVEQIIGREGETATLLSKFFGEPKLVWRRFRHTSDTVLQVKRF